MRRRGKLAALALLLCLLLPAAGLADPPAGKRPPPGAVPNEAYPAALREQVVQALTKASEHLFGLQEPEGCWPESTWAPKASWPGGSTALALHALLEAGAKPDDLRVERGFAYLRTLPHERTYLAASTLLALWARYSTRHADYRQILETEDIGDPGARARLRKPENRLDLALARTCFDTLLGAQRENGAFGYGPDGALHWDISNTQYGLLGLRAARELGLAVKNGAWLAALRFLMDWQEEDGPAAVLKTALVEGGYRLVFSEKAWARGFGYTPASPTHPKQPYPTATASGVASLLLVQNELEGSSRFFPKDRERARVAIRDGLAWLQDYLPTHPAGHHNGGSSAFDYYFLYAVERLGVLGHLRFIGTYDWYVVGAEQLVRTQRPDGGWGPGLVLDTSWAVLFLKRASFRARRGTVTPSLPGPAAPGSGTAPGGAGGGPAPPPPALAKADALLRGGILASEDGFEQERPDLVREGVRLLEQARDLLAPLSEDLLLSAEDRDLALELLTDAEGRIEEAEDWLTNPPPPTPDPVPGPQGDPAPLVPEAQAPEPAPAPAPPTSPAPSAPAPSGPPDAPPPAPTLPLDDLPPAESFPNLTQWCRAVGFLHDRKAAPALRALLAQRVAQEAGVIGLPLLLGWFGSESDPGARSTLHAALAAIGTARVATEMTRFARADAAPRWDDAVDVLCRCLKKPDEQERERPFVRAIRRFHRLKDHRLTSSILNRLHAMGTEGVAALGQVLYVEDFGFHDRTIARLATKQDRRAVPPLVYKMNRFLFEYRVQLPAHQALLQIGWYAVPELIDRLDDKAAGI